MADDKDEEGKGKFRIELRPTSLFALLFVALAAISLAYIGGVMSGRTHGEAPVLPEAANQPEQPVSADRGILAAEDLNFARALRREQGEKEPHQENRPTTVAEPAAPAPLPASAQPSSPQPAAGQPPEPPDGALYDYVFQMGAFKDEKGADALRQSLEGHGLRTALERSGKMCIVLVRLRGNAGRAAEVGEIAAGLRLGAPVERSRKIVP